MKKWLIALCCILLAGVVAFVTFMSNSNSRLDALNRDLGEVQAENNSLKEKAGQDEKTISDLNSQVENLTAENRELTETVDTLTVQNGQLNETLDSVNRNLSSSQQKLQGVMYILTDGVQGSINSVLSPYVRIFQDVPLDSPYYDAVRFVTDWNLMVPAGEDVFGAYERTSLPEVAQSLARLQGKDVTAEEAAASLLETEQAWLASRQDEKAEEAAEPAPEAAEEAPAEEAAEPAPEAAEEAPAEEAAEPAPEAAEEAPAEEAAEPAPEAAEEAPAEEAAEPAPEAAGADTSVLTRERLLSLCGAYAAENGKDLSQVAFPESESEEALRGDLALVLVLLRK